MEHGGRLFSALPFVRFCFCCLFESQNVFSREVFKIIVLKQLSGQYEDVLLA